jgi:hypothetical protein
MNLPAILVGVPAPWFDIVAAVNGIRLFGAPGVRDPDYPCEAFDPVPGPEYAPGDGDCDTDGHYMCLECSRVSIRRVRRSAEQCEDCGVALYPYPYLGPDCACP